MNETEGGCILLQCYRGHVKKLITLKFIKHTIIFIISATLSIYSTAIISKDLNLQKIRNFTELEKCPVCYGESACELLFFGKVLLNRHQNSEQTYNGYYTKNSSKIAFKKLASASYLRRFDENLCKTWNLQKNCTPTEVYKKADIDDIKFKINNSVHWNRTSSIFEQSQHLVFCPYLDGLYDFLRPVLSNNYSDISGNITYRADLIKIWTLLHINVEPILLQVIQTNVPFYEGCCGRLEVVSHEGRLLSSMKDVDKLQQLSIALSLTNLAVDMTFNNDRFRFYMMEWSRDNIMVSKNYDVTFVNYDRVIVLDTKTAQSHIHVPAHKEFPLWYTRYSRNNHTPQYRYSNEYQNNLCSFYLSDHNFWELCNFFVGGDNPFLIISDLLDNNLRKLMLKCTKPEVDKIGLAAEMQLQFSRFTSDLLENDLHGVLAIW